MARIADISVKDLTKRYGDILAVDHIDFEVKRGEFFGFLGPNGAGKTTTIRMLTGVIKPDDGTARISGYDIQREPIRAKQIIGVAPEMSNAYVDLSAWRNLMFMAGLYGVGKKAREERARELLKMFDLYDRKDQLVKGFSKGMKQKLILCMAQINNPQILFLDEPTSGLDVQSSRLIRNVLRNLNDTGKTIFLTTHNIEEANQLCDRVAIIDRGRIISIDSPERLRSRIEGSRFVEVAFDKQIKSELLLLEGVSDVKKIEKKFKLYTDEPNEVIFHLVNFARSNNLKVVDLKILAPSLEDVFIKLTEGEA
jgi:ABC-2 type transport system ATP-binding protein